MFILFLLVDPIPVARNDDKVQQEDKQVFGRQVHDPIV
jgi:hypothetical protein